MGSFGECSKVLISGEKRNACDAALGNLRVSEACFAALCQHLRSQLPHFAFDDAEKYFTELVAEVGTLVLFVVQSGQGIHASRSSRGNPARQERNPREEQRHNGEGHQVVRSNSIEKGVEELGHRQRGG